MVNKKVVVFYYNFFVYIKINTYLCTRYEIVYKSMIIWKWI